MKGLILSGGQGTRLRPFTNTQAKQLLPLANKPVLFYAIEAMIASGINHIGIVVSPLCESIRKAVGNGKRWGDKVRIEYIYQEQPRGLAHALVCAREFLGDHRFALLLGDIVIGESLAPFIAGFFEDPYPPTSSLLLKPTDNPGAYGVAEITEVLVNKTGQLLVRRVVEKPALAVSNLALVGMYCFDSTIFQAIEHIQPSARDELELTDAIQWLIDHNYRVQASILEGYWIDTGQEKSLLAANRYMLTLLVPSIDDTSEISSDSCLSGPIVIQAGAKIVNSVLHGPAIIGEHATIFNAKIGPFVSIAGHVRIERSEITSSIVMEHSQIINVSHQIAESVIGRYVRIHPAVPGKTKHYFALGDYSYVELTS